MVEGIGTFLFIVDGNIFNFYVILPDGHEMGWDITDNMNESPTSRGFKGLIPLDTSNICLLYNDNTTQTLFETTENWKNMRMKLIDSKDDMWESRVARLYLDGRDYTHPNKTGFSNLRKYGRTDCKLKCSDGVIIPAHMLVLASQWPLLHNVVAEKPQTDSVTIKYPSSLAELMVSYFYD